MLVTGGGWNGEFLSVSYRVHLEKMQDPRGGGGKCRAVEMSRRVRRVLATQDDQSVIPAVHVVGENRFP